MEKMVYYQDEKSIYKIYAILSCYIKHQSYFNNSHVIHRANTLDQLVVQQDLDGCLRMNELVVLLNSIIVKFYIISSHFFLIHHFP